MAHIVSALTAQETTPLGHTTQCSNRAGVPCNQHGRDRRNCASQCCKKRSPTLLWELSSGASCPSEIPRGFSLAETHSNPLRADQLASPAAFSTLCHAEQPPKHAETQLTEPRVMLEPCRSESRALAVEGAQRSSQGCSVGMEGKAGALLSHLPCRRCCAVSPTPRRCGAGNAQPL